jgi:hypothetical protein
MYNGSTILLCVTIFVIHKQCLIMAHCCLVTVDEALTVAVAAKIAKLHPREIPQIKTDEHTCVVLSTTFPREV